MNETTRTDELLEMARKHLIRFHPVEKEGPIIARGLGSKVWDVEGNEYIDFVSGQISATIGHNHPRIVEAMVRAGEKMIHSSKWLLQEESILFAERMARHLPESLTKMIFKNSGTEANEAALHMAKMHTGNWEVVSIDRSFFGNTAQSRSNTFVLGHRGLGKGNAYGPQMPGSYALPIPYCFRCPLRLKFPSCEFACAELGFELFDSQSNGYPAAVIAEPLMSAAGIIEPPPGYFELLRKKADERGMKVIYDESQTAFGRIGTMFAFENHVAPDFLVLAKAMGGGAALSCMATSAEIEQDAFEKGWTGGSTHSNDPLVCAMGMAVLEVVQEERLPEQALEKGSFLVEQFRSMADRFEQIGDIRGRGLLLGIEFVTDRDTRAPADELGKKFSQACLERGLIISIIRMPGLNSVCRMAPPLTIGQEEMDRALAIMEDALVEVTGARPGSAG